MSTKNLARTIIEGGRHKGNKWDRRNSHAESRAREKNYIQEVSQDVENWYDYDIEPLDKVYKGFDDKLGPIYRWLGAQVGRPWNEVRSEISEKFDTRTTAGRHIVHDHLLQSVEVTPDIRYQRYTSVPDIPNASYRYNDFYVDEAGLLQRKVYIKRRKPIPHFNTNQIANWLNGRVVGYAGKKLFWFVPADKNKKRGGYRHQWKTQWGGWANYHYYSYNSNPLRFLYLYDEPIHKREPSGALVLNENGKPIILDYKTTWKDGRPTFRQDRRLNDKELAFWNTIPEYYRNQVLAWSPNWVEPEKPDPYRYYY